MVCVCVERGGVFERVCVCLREGVWWVCVV